MRGGTLEHGYEIPLDDLASNVYDQNRDLASRHGCWLESLRDRMPLDELLRERRTRATHS